MRIEREAARHLAAQAELLAVGRQQELDGRGIEPDAVVQPLHAIRRIDALERQHRGQDLALGDGGRIAREQRLDEEVPAGLDDEIHLVARDVDTRQLVDDLADLGDDDAVLEGGRLDHGRRVLGVGAGIEVAVAVGALGGDQRHVGRQIDEVAGEQLEIGMDRAELDLAAEQHGGDARRLRAGIGEVELAGDAALEQVEMLGQHDARLHHVEIAHLCRIGRQQRGAQHVRLLLVVALEADQVARPYNCLQEMRGVTHLDDLALSDLRAGLQAGIAGIPAAMPACPPKMEPSMGHLFAVGIAG